ncbi:DNA (cytosine-5)-methyltransferase 3-like, partial [Homarus americanus]
TQWIMLEKRTTPADMSFISNADRGRLVWAKIAGSRAWPDIHLSPKVERCLCRIKKTLLRTASSSSSSQSDSVDSSNANERQNSKPKDLLLKAARDGKYDIETLCISCDQTDCEVVSPHPYIKGGTCGVCKEEFEDNKLACEEDGSNDMYCAVCGSLGEVLECDEPDCKRVFCTWCVELLVSPSAVQRIIETDPWHCFLCKPYHPDTHGLIQPRMNWQEKLAAKSGNHQSNSCNMILEDDVPDKSTFPNRPLRVLSLFDGIGTGFYALDKLGLEVEAYFASEINKSAMNVATLNFGTKITFIGDVQNFTNGQITEICPIDLLIGGSPCNDFSFVNPNRKGLFDPTGSGILFFHFFRVQKTIQAVNGNTHLFWLFENVSNMPQEIKLHINIFLEKEPVKIDAKYCSPQRRPRYFWGNIPGMRRPFPPEMEKDQDLSRCLLKISGRKAVVKKINCVTTNSASLKLGGLSQWPIRMNDIGDVPWSTEIEKIFGFPQHYTDVGNLTPKERQTLLGKSWSVPVVLHILKPLTKYFPRKKKHLTIDESNNTVQSKKQQDPTLNPTIEDEVQLSSNILNTIDANVASSTILPPSSTSDSLRRDENMLSESSVTETEISRNVLSAGAASYSPLVSDSKMVTVGPEMNSMMCGGDEEMTPDDFSLTSNEEQFAEEHNTAHGKAAVSVTTALAKTISPKEIHVSDIELQNNVSEHSIENDEEMQDELYLTLLEDENICGSSPMYTSKNTDNQYTRKSLDNSNHNLTDEAVFVPRDIMSSRPVSTGNMFSSKNILETKAESQSLRSKDRANNLIAAKPYTLRSMKIKELRSVRKSTSKMRINHQKLKKF